MAVGRLALVLGFVHRDLARRARVRAIGRGMSGVALLVSACGARSPLEAGTEQNRDDSSSGGRGSVGISGMGAAQSPAGGASSAGGATARGGSQSAGSGGATLQVGGVGGSGGAGGAGGAPPKLIQRAISAGNETTCGLKEDGTVWCWGANGNGQLGDGSMTKRSLVPVRVVGVDAAVSIAAGGASTPVGWGAINSAFNCAVLLDGTVRCWGQVPGVEDATSVPIPVPGIQHAVMVAGGNRHACALLERGSIQCWGDNSSGQLGNGTTANSAKPVTVSGIRNAKAVVGLGTDFSCALLMGGSVGCWGDLPPGSSITMMPGSSKPIAIDIDGSTVRGIAAGRFGGCAVSSNGSVRSWGLDPKNLAIMPTMQPASAVAVGVHHACALLSNGTIQCWGLFAFGQGNAAEEPAEVPGIRDAVAVSAGSAYSCALLKSGRAWCWGINDAGQLGNRPDLTIADNYRSFTPVEVLGF